MSAGMRTTCPTCGSILWRHRVKRFGVQMSPLKARLIDIVRLAGPFGAESEALLECLPIKGEKRQRTLNVHINQINEALEDTNWRIIGWRGTKFLVRKDRKALPLPPGRGRRTGQQVLAQPGDSR
jgi:hypothetical protein